MRVMEETEQPTEPKNQYGGYIWMGGRIWLVRG